MENLLFSINVVLPIFSLMMIGYFLRQIKIFDKDFLVKANNFAFKALLPVLLFNNIYKSHISDSVNTRLILFAISIVLILVGIMFIVVPKFEKDKRNRGVIIQAIYRSNFVLFGVTLSKNIFGDANLEVVTSLTAVIIPLFNFLAVVILDWYSEVKSNLLDTAVNIVKNPLIIGSVLGIVFSIFGIRLPGFVENVVSDVAGMATPLALMVLGGEIEIKNLSKNVRHIYFAAFGRLILFPAIILIAAVLIGFRDVELGALLSMSAPSCAVSSYTMAQQYDCNYELAGQLVFVTTMICPLTIFMFIYLLKTFALI